MQLKIESLPAKYRLIYRSMMSISPRVLVRLTYPTHYPDTLEALDQLDKLTGLLKKHGNQGIWFLDQQARGAPFFWLLLSRYLDKEELSYSWYHIVKSDNPQHLKAGTSVSGFKYQKGLDYFFLKKIIPIINQPNAQYNIHYGAFGNLQAWIFLL